MGTQKIYKTGGSLKHAEAVRPELKRRASRQAAAGRCRSKFPIFGFFVEASLFYAWRGTPRNFFQAPSAEQCIGGALAGP